MAYEFHRITYSLHSINAHPIARNKRGQAGNGKLTHKVPICFQILGGLENLNHYEILSI